MFPTLLAKAGGFWMPERASSYAGDVDRVFSFIYWLSAFFFVLIVTLMVLFVWRYRYREGHKRSEADHHSTALELTWTIIPTILVVIIFRQGIKGYLNITTPPPNAYEIQVAGSMWQWLFTYPNGVVDSELHVPVNTPVRLVMTSQDVIHSFYVPQFRLKKDVVPGRYEKAWFQAEKIGQYDLYCAEYCGLYHSTMRAKVFVHEMGEFQNWLEQASKWENRMTPLEAGKMLVERRGCLQCHSQDGSTLQGPSFKDLYGSPQSFNGGQKAIADENYIRESIYEPGVKIVDGFSNVMPSFKGLLREQDVNAIVLHLKSLSSHYKGDLNVPATQPAGGPATRPTTAPAPVAAAAPAARP